MQVNMQAVDSNPLLKGMMQKAGLENRNVSARWEDLNGLASTIGNSVVETAQQVAIATQQLKDKSFDKMNETRIAIEGLTNDLTNVADTLIQIQSQHKDKTGIIGSPEEYDQFHNHFNNYHELSTRFTELIMTPMIVITEALTDVATREKQLAKINADGSIEGEAVQVMEH